MYKKFFYTFMLETTEQLPLLEKNYILMLLRSLVTLSFLTPEPNGVGEGVYGIGCVLRRRRRRRDAVCVWTL